MSATPLWRRALLVTHRWLGIGGGVLFVTWFASGIVMMYVRMPVLGPEERLALLPALDVAAARVSPAAAARAADARDGALATARLGMLEGRPLYRLGPGAPARAVFADTGELLEPFTAEEALRVVGGLLPEHAATMRYDGHLTAPDQWTLQSRAWLPLHRIALGDADATRVYLSDPTGDLVMKTTARGRWWAYAGPVLHWLYFTPLRVRSGLWAQTIIWLSIAGCLLTLSGLGWGLIRFTFRRRRSLGDGDVRGARSAPGSPYSGLLRWHHCAGLAFGFFAFTWILSGGLSMDPWSWHPGTAPTSAQVERVAGGTVGLRTLTAEHVRVAAAALAAPETRSPGPGSTLKELGFSQLGGEPFVVAYDGDGPPRSVSALSPGAGAFARFSDTQMLAAARAAVPGVPIEEARWLTEFDAYYYARADQPGVGSRLPVLRVRYGDPQDTWLYLDPVRGAIVHKEERLTRLNRWLYRGLHSLDFPGFYASRPLWDLVVIGLSLGGLTVAATTLLPGWRRVARVARRILRP